MRRERDASSPARSARTRQLPGMRDSLRRFRRAAALLQPYWGSYAKLAAMGLVVAAVGLLGPYFTKLLIDGVYPSHDIGLLGVVVGAMLAHALFSQLMGTAQGYYGQIVGAHLTADSNVFLVNHVQHLPLRFFERLPVGDILSRFGDLSRALGSVKKLFDLVFVRSIFLILIPPILIAMNWRLALVAFATVPVTWGINVATARAIRRRWKYVAEAQAEVRALNVETLSHIRLLKSMGLERESFRRTAETAGAAREETLAAARLSVALGTVNGLTRTAGNLLLTYIGWRMILGGGLTLGSFIAFTAYLGRVRGPLASISSLFSDFQRTAITLDRVFELLDEPPEAEPTLLYDPAYAPAPVQFDGSIRVENLRFQYRSDGFAVEIPDLDFSPGSVTALVGESGSGKSTLLRLLAGLECPTSGAIRYGRHAHDTLPLPSIRRTVAVAWQDADLLRGSLRSNIAYGVDQVSEQRLRDVIRVCQLDTLVDDLPDGLDTPVAEWGATLSGGQQQRLSLARALIRETPVLLLDEITSNLDSDTEAALLDDLMPFVRGTTVIVATHRGALLRHVDRVVKIASGRLALVEDGDRAVLRAGPPDALSSAVGS